MSVTAAARLYTALHSIYTDVGVFEILGNGFEIQPIVDGLRLLHNRLVECAERLPSSECIRHAASVNLFKPRLAVTSENQSEGHHDRSTDSGPGHHRRSNHPNT
jgi:hypothetical protein